MDRTGSQRLESWKEIAAYLNRDVRTVRRWEKSLQLPVHRMRREKLSAVYAIRQEIDEWQAGRVEREFEPEVVEIQLVRRAPRWQIWALGAMLGAVVASAFWPAWRG
jgi:hypothetical protein